MTGLRPFWRYYGGKWRAAPRYPRPAFGTIVEPFAGAAGYALRYPDRQVILVERYAVVAEIWRYLIAVPAAEIRAIPLVDHVDDLPDRTPEGARMLVGMCMNNSAKRPNKQTSSGLRARAHRGWCEAWSAPMRSRVAAQVDAIRHWRVIEGDYTGAPDIEATWFVDPPYQGRPGSHYVHGSAKIDYAVLGSWCQARLGQRIVCEAEGATWLPFRPFGATNGVNGRQSREAVWP